MYYPCSENKGADQLRGYREADLRLCFAYAKSRLAHNEAHIFAEPEVDIPSDFPFPFEPYNIQKGFMKEVYRCLELGKVGIFESPTGTVSHLGTF